MLGVDRAEDMLRKPTFYGTTATYEHLPNRKAFYVNLCEQPLVFYKHRDGTVAVEASIKKGDHEKPWQLKLTRFQAAKGSSTLQHSSVSCAQARNENFNLAGESTLI